jgi:hypothetical protein
VWKIPAGGGEPVQVTRQVTRNGGYNPFESEDGKTIYYTGSGSPSPLWKVAADGGGETQLVDSVSFQNFAATRAGIYFITGQELRFFSFATGKSKTILSIPKPVTFGLSVSPDEQWLLYTQVDQEGSDLMVVENFR